MPTAYFLFFLLLSIGCYLIFPVVKFIQPPCSYAGIFFILFGVIVNIWTDRLFKQRNTTVKPHLMPTALEVSGPFRISRHPMYLGMAAVLLGIAILEGSLIEFVFPVLFIIAMELIFIPIEEQNLYVAFGQRYIDYKKHVRRWI